jgi:hypothetical protein
MRLHIRLNPSKEEDRLITRWLARYHRGARRQGIIKACLAAGARAFFAKPEPPRAPSPERLTAPITIPTFAGLGALIQTQQTPRTTRPPGGPHDPAA